MRKSGKDHPDRVMIVVAIVAILAAIALPAYQDYTIRSQSRTRGRSSRPECASRCEYFGDRGTWPTDNASLGLTNTIAGSYVSDVSNTAGVIRIVYGNNANSKILGSTLGIGAAANANGDIAWVCGQRTVPSGYTRPLSVAPPQPPPCCRNIERPIAASRVSLCPHWVRARAPVPRW
ncbi:MAG: pilin [Lysobacterales bacterium]